MSKRELAMLGGAEDLNGSKHKRRRDLGGSSSDVDITMSDPIEPKARGSTLSRAEVKEHGARIWQTVKDAEKDGRSLAVIFLRKPLKRSYPDYYAIIKEPIALDDIKKKLDDGTYASLEAVKQDFELMFGNAKQYNQPESQVYGDAKDLLKMVHKMCKKILPSDEDGDKPKPPSLNRLMKTRLEKLVLRKDSTGRVIAAEFMHLPSKKIWPVYYKEIQRPQCFENIFKRIKAKDYHSSAVFAADVELVFSNALTFNQEGSDIANDALTLRDHFRLLMSDMPPPHNLPEYASAKPVNKIKIRPPQAAQPMASGSSHHPTKHETSTHASLLLRVPAAQSTHASTSTSQLPTAAPAVNTYTLPVAPATAPRPPPVPKPSTPQAIAPRKAATPQPPLQQTVSFINATPAYYPQPQPVYVPPPVAPPVVATPPVLRASSVVNTQMTSQSPAPPIIYPPTHQLKSVTLRIEPKGRYLTLDHRDGVRNWAVRLVPGETSIIFSDVTYMEDEADSSDDEDVDVEKDDDDADMDVDGENADGKNGRKKMKTRGRGRPPKAVAMAVKAAQAAAAAKAAKAAKKQEIPKRGEVQLKLNTFAVTEETEKTGEWSVYLPVGSNTIEIGEVGGMIWKVYADRQTDA